MANQCTQSMFSLSSSFANKAECTKKVFLANCTYEDWHQRLGHPTFNIVSQALSSCNTLFFNKTEIPNCNACQMYKFHKLPFQSSSTIIQDLLNLLFQIYGVPLLLFLAMVFRYYVTFVDSFNHFTWIYFLKRKSELYSSFMRLQNSS